MKIFRIILTITIIISISFTNVFAEDGSGCMFVNRTVTVDSENNKITVVYNSLPCEGYTNGVNCKFLYAIVTGPNNYKTIVKNVNDGIPFDVNEIGTYVVERIILDNYISFNASVNLTDSIDLNISSDIDEDFLNKIKIYYQIGNEDAEVITPDSANYSFTISINSKQLDEEIKIWAIYDNCDDCKTSIKNLSVSGYCEQVGSSLATALRNYGNASKVYFNSNVDVDLDSNAETVKSNLSGYKYTVKNSNNLKAVNASLILDSRTSLKVEFSGDDVDKLNSYTKAITKDGTEISSSNYEISGNYLIIHDIKASDLLKNYVIKVSDGNKTLVNLKYSPMSYAYEALTSSITSNALKNLVCKLYNYGFEAAKVN